MVHCASIFVERFTYSVLSESEQNTNSNVKDNISNAFDDSFWEAINMTLQWLGGEWIDEDRSYYEVQVDSDCSCSVKTIRADGRMILTKGLIQMHGKDIY